MLQFFNTWFGYGQNVDPEQKGGRILEVSAKAKDKDGIDRPYNEQLWEDLPDDDEKKTLRKKKTNWELSRKLELLWSKTNVGELTGVIIVPGK